MKRTQPLRIAILDAEDVVKWRGYTEFMWLRAMDVQPFDKVKVFKCFQGEWPAPENVDAEFDVVILGGSHYSAYEDIPWIRSLEEVLRKYVTTSKTHFIACCFGHQLLAKALGGEIGSNPTSKFVLGVEEIKFDVPCLRKYGLSLDLDYPAEFGKDSIVDGESTAVLGLVESHGDQVLVVPPGAATLATSDSAGCEALMVGPRVLSVQFHPEMSPRLAREKIWPALTANGRLDPIQSLQADESLRGTLPAALAAAADGAAAHAQDDGAAAAAVFAGLDLARGGAGARPGPMEEYPEYAPGARAVQAMLRRFAESACGPEPGGERPAA